MVMGTASIMITRIIRHPYCCTLRSAANLLLDQDQFFMTCAKSTNIATRSPLLENAVSMELMLVAE
jgi:hypothetical protein